MIGLELESAEGSDQTINFYEILFRKMVWYTLLQFILSRKTLLSNSILVI